MLFLHAAKRASDNTLDRHRLVCPTITRSAAARKRRPLQRAVGQRPRRPSRERTSTISLMVRRWNDVVEIFKSIPRSLRTGGRLGRIFRLRDQGRLDEALTKALELTDELLTNPRFVDKPNAIIAAATVDEIAVRLGREKDSREVLERALKLIDKEMAETAGRPRSEDYHKTLEAHARRFRERLNP
jgi:hypothetical protein